MRFLPILHTEALRFITLLIKLDPENPIPELIKARIHRTKLLLLIRQFESDPTSTELVKLIKDRFKTAFESYTIVYKTEGKFNDGAMIQLSNLEFAKLILDIHFFFKNRLRVDLPDHTPQYYLKMADKVLKQVKKNESVNTLKAEIQEALNALQPTHIS